LAADARTLQACREGKTFLEIAFVPVKRRAVSLLSLLIAVRFREDPVPGVPEIIVVIDMQSLVPVLTLLHLSGSVRRGMRLPVTRTPVGGIPVM
jgi:hypothetical protein